MSENTETLISSKFAPQNKNRFISFNNAQRISTGFMDETKILALHFLHPNLEKHTRRPSVARYAVRVSHIADDVVYICSYFIVLLIALCAAV